jgi:methylthioribulose-1-phosphate dehydratase
MERIISQELKQSIYLELQDIKGILASRGWFPATSGNLSMRVGEFQRDHFSFAITASGKDKSKQTDEDFLLVDEQGKPIESTILKPSAETLIHAEIYRLTGAGAIFHVHTVYNNLISERYASRHSVPIDGVELIKAFNIWKEDAHIEIPILPNYADIPSIAALIEGRLQPGIPGFVIRKHGVCAWGANAFEAKRHLEAFEFLFEYAYRLHVLNK